jgi:metallo-beta-lactamase family protein
MIIEFHGAVGTVTGSQFLVTGGSRRVLVDCGMFQGSPEETLRNRMPFGYPPASLDAVLLTHAHLDHCGRLPALVAAGFGGPVYATAATADLAAIVLRDSAKLQEEFAKRWERRHRNAVPRTEAAEEEALAAEDEDVPKQIRSAPPEARAEIPHPLYTLADVEETISRFEPVAYDQAVPVAPGISAAFHDAGHILGSAMIELRLDGPKPTNIVFSGDLGRDDTPILRDPTRLEQADFVVVESTYGDREHAPHAEGVDVLVAAVDEVALAKGVLLVPAFAIGRTQELVWTLDHLLREGRVPKLPLFIDSPMATRASDVYLRHPEAYDEQTGVLLRSGDSPLEYPDEEYTITPDKSKSIRHRDRPFMIIASSGMLTGGRIVHHLKDFLGHASTTLLFIGYQAEGTLGRHLQTGGKTARLDGQEYPVRCRVRNASGFSAHADEDELISWLTAFTARSKPRRIFVVHGDPEPAANLARRIETDLGVAAHVPRYRESIDLDS